MHTGALGLDRLIRARAIHSMTGEMYRAVGLRGAEIVAASAEPDGLDDLAGTGTVTTDAGDLTLLPAFADSHEHLMEASRNTLLVPVDQAHSVAEFTAMVATAARAAAPGAWIMTPMAWHESNLAENRLPPAPSWTPPRRPTRCWPAGAGILPWPTPPRSRRSASGWARPTRPAARSGGSRTAARTACSRAAPSGRLADIVAYPADPLTADLDDLPGLTPAFTIVGGHPVHDLGGLLASPF